MVTVVATQELEAGDELRRFQAKAAQDEPRRGNNNNRYVVVVGLVAVGVWKLSLHMVFFLLVRCAFLLLFIGTRVRDDDLRWVFCVMFSVLHNVTALACW